MTLHLKNIYILVLVCFAMACSKSNSARNSQGTAGSLAKFTISSGHLYTISFNELKAYDITNASSPVFKTSTRASEAETIFAYEDKLFIGARSGIYIYDISNPSTPKLTGEATHLRACDPVIADNKYAYSTLQGSSRCGSASPGLYIYDITNITQPDLKKFVAMPTPKGLGVSGNTLYVCGEEYGLSVFDISTPTAPQEKKVLKDANSYQDVILSDDLLICYVDSGLLLYDVSAPHNPTLLQKINQ